MKIQTLPCLTDESYVGQNRSYVQFFYSLGNYLVVLNCIVDNFFKFQNMGSCRVVARDKFPLSTLAYWRAYAIYCIWQCFTSKPFSVNIYVHIYINILLPVQIAGIIWTDLLSAFYSSKLHVVT